MKIKILYDNEVAVDKEKMIPSYGFSCLIDKEVLHMGSLLTLLPFDKRSDKTVYFPSATVNMRKELGKRANLITEKEPVAVTKDIYTTGLMGRDTGIGTDTAIEEQALVIKGKKGLVILTGCAHPGVGKIIERVKDLFGDDIYALIGGLHDFRDLELLKGIKLIVPCHCTVEKERILKEFSSLRCGVGAEIEIEV